MSNRKIYKSFIAFALVIILAVLALSFSAFADADSYELKSIDYESSDDTKYSISADTTVEAFSYGQSSIGTFSLNGSVNKETELNGIAAYATTDTLTISYAYDGKYQTKNKEEWNLISDTGKTVDGKKYSKQIKNGILIIQKSSDGETWKNAVDPVYNLFSAKKIDWDNLYSLTDKELRNGTYFRVVIAYKMGRKTGESPATIIPPKAKSDIYEYSYCSEVYEFYACYGSSLIEIRDLKKSGEGETLNSGDIVEDGFVVDPGESCNTVSVQLGDNAATVIDSTTSYTDVGKYNIIVKTPLNQKFTYYIEVSGGLKTESLTPDVYENEKNDGYTEDHLVTLATAGGISSHTILTIGQNSSDSIVKSEHDGFDAYGVTGNQVSFYLQIANSDVLKENGWKIASDTWGKKNTQKVAGNYVGQVNSGALIIQTSTDGENWENVDKLRYADGIYTTDYEKYYGDLGDVLIYTPDGNDILNGLYVRIKYAYEVTQSSTKSDYRMIEEYQFYLCSNELDAVTFHNLSAKDETAQILEEYDKATAAVYQRAETMRSGSYTVSGFEIDTSLNPTVTCTVTKNGKAYTVPLDNRITETGKYVIHLTSAVNDTKDITLFVDRMDTDAAMKLYFGDAFISGKRIYDDGQYAVFEGGLTEYNIAEVDQNYLPLSGEITNQGTGEVIEIEATRDAKSGTLTTPGFYEAVFTMVPDFDVETSSGDCRKFTFHFTIIEEGTAPGPQVNQEHLKEYATTTITDSYPLYYGVMFSSAGAGDITLAFATKDEALKYARNYEEGTVEQQSDGTYRYIGSFYVQQKDKYDSNWELMDAVDYFAEQAVQPLYFDLSDQYTVLTLDTSKDDLPDNLRKLELDKSIVVFKDNQQKNLLTDTGTLPIISPKPYSYLSIESGEIDSGYNDFMFERDNYGCDSDSVEIQDSNGNTYTIEYEKGVGAQLAAYDCPSGIVTIIEKTIYGDTASYKAVYIADGDNTTSLTLSTQENGEEVTRTLTQENDGNTFTAEEFSISSIADELDPCSLVLVEHNNVEYSYAADQVPMEAWADPGEYTIKAVNRLGFYYSVTISVVESDVATITFKGDGTETASSILTVFGERNVALPNLTRTGYTLQGFEDENGNQYSGKIDLVDFRGTLTLTAIWEPKQYIVTLQSPEGTTIDTLIVDYGRAFELPEPTVNDGYVFTGWTLDGEPLNSNVFTLNKESDITLVATQTKDNNNAGNSGNVAIVWVVVIVFAVLAVLVGIMRFGKKHTIEDGAENELQENDDDQ